jgi:hypothetical protein
MFENVELVIGGTRGNFSSDDTTASVGSTLCESYGRSCSSTCFSQNESEESFEDIAGKYYDVYGRDDLSELEEVSSDVGDWGYFVDFNDNP